MLKSNYAKVKWNSKNKKRFMELGYKFTKMKDSFEVLIEHLTRYSNAEIEVICDYCTKEIVTPYCTYYNNKLKNFNKNDCCEDCWSEKLKESNLLKYGTEFPMRLECVKEALQETMLQNYGVKNPMQNKDIQKKVTMTNLDKYGVEYPSQSSIIQEKTRQTFYKNGTTPTSSQQINVYEMLKDFFNVELNYPFSKCNIDIALFHNSLKIAIEYDCKHWHDEKSDRKRDEFLKSNGWKVLRIKSRRKVPSLDTVVDSINKLINTNRVYTQIVLSDWENESQSIII